MKLCRVCTKLVVLRETWLICQRVGFVIAGEVLQLWRDEVEEVLLAAELLGCSPPPRTADYTPVRGSA